MNSTLETSRTLIPFGFTCCYTVRLDANSQGVSALADAIIKQLLPQELFRGEPLINLRGLESPAALLTECAAPPPAQGEELFYLGGEMTPPQEQEEDSVQEVTLPSPFRISIHTEFLEFQGSNDIVHTAALKRAWALPQSFPLKDFVLLINPEITALRFGLDFFRARFLSALSGSSPVAYESLQIDACAGQAAIQIISEGLKRRSDLPLQKGRWFSKTAQLLKQTLGFDLEQDYLRRTRDTR